MDSESARAGFPPLEPPWFIDRLEPSAGNTQVHVLIGRHQGAMACPVCAASSPVQESDGLIQSWRHLDLGQVTMYLKAAVPTVTCAQHGNQTVLVPWAEPCSRFTRRFEAKFLTEMTGPDPLAQAAMRMRLAWDDAFALKERLAETNMLRNFAGRVARDPGDIQAHKGLAVLHRNRGEETRARHHADLAFTQQPLEHLPYEGSGTPIPLLLLIPCVGGTVPWQRVIDRRIFSIASLAAEYADLNQPLPEHSVVFNAIGDADICQHALAQARLLLHRTKAPVINQPEAVANTGRLENARRLGQLPGVVAPRTALMSRSRLMQPDAVREVEKLGFDFPVLLRSPGFQTGQHFALVEKPSELGVAAQSLPGVELLVIAYLDARRSDGLYRKFRVMCIDQQFYPLHLAVSEHWKVHYFTAGMKDQAKRQEEEAAFLNHMPEVLGATAMTALARIRDTLGLDYCGFDVGLDGDGRILLFEANATMLINPPGPDAQWDYRRPAMSAALNAAQTLVRSRCRAPNLTVEKTQT